MKKTYYLLTLTALISLSGCNVINSTSSPTGSSSIDDTSSNTSSNSTSSSDGQDVIDNVEIGKDVALINSQEYLDFWSPTSTLSFDIKFSTKSYEYLQKYSSIDYLKYQDYYFPADLTIKVNETSYTFNDVGFRRKGNTSRYDDFSNGRIHYKLSFGETFDEEFYKANCPEIYHDWTNDTSGKEQREDRTFCDMEKLDLKWNRNYDQTRLRQTYTNYIFREKGLIAQQTSLTNVNLYNGDTKQFSEIYEVLESIDKILMKRFFNKESAKGDLYKLSWGADFVLDTVLTKKNGEYVVRSNQVGVSDAENNYEPVYDIKTNKKTTTHSDLINFITKINQKGSNFDDELTNIVDIDYLARFLTYSWAVGDPDDIRCNYNNTYIYFEPTTHKMYLIPYDHDRSLGVTKDGCGLMPSKRFTTTKCTGYGGDSYQRNPLFWRSCIISVAPNNDGDLSTSYPVCQNSLDAIKPYITSLKQDKLFTVEGFNEYINQFAYKNEDGNYSDSNNESFANYASNLQSKISEENNYLFK